VEIALKNWLNLWLRCPQCGSDLENEYCFVPVCILELLHQGHSLPLHTIETLIREGKERSAAHQRQQLRSAEVIDQINNGLKKDE
jgi:hypothetical protein